MIFIIKNYTRFFIFFFENSGITYYERIFGYFIFQLRLKELSVKVEI